MSYIATSTEASRQKEEKEEPTSRIYEKQHLL